MNGTITLKEVLDWIDSLATFDIAFVTCDLKRKTGGEHIEIKNARKHCYINSSEKAKLEKAQPRSAHSKNPNHYDNSTRNIRLENNEIRKVHIRLIRRFNQKTVL